MEELIKLIQWQNKVKQLQIKIEYDKKDMISLEYLDSEENKKEYKQNLEIRREQEKALEELEDELYEFTQGTKRFKVSHPESN